jgi:sensor histidine kinase YesM
MTKNRITRQFAYGVSFFVALFVNFPIVFLNMPHLEKSGKAQLDIIIQIVFCFFYSITAIYLIYQGIKLHFSKLVQFILLLFTFSLFVVLLTTTNVIIIGLSVKIIPTVVMRGLLIMVIAYFFSRFILEIEKKNEVLLENEQLKHENLQAQLASLKEQLNPHFLFNSLNTLSWLINEDKDKSQQFLQKLAHVLRSSLSMQQQPLICLSEELALVDSYIFLLEMRFGDNLKISRDIIKAEKYHIPPISVQMLIENAIKHNIISTASPLSIHIELDTNSHILIVRNSLNAKPNSEGTGIGLANLNERFKILTNREIEIIQNDTFTVILPLES